MQNYAQKLSVLKHFFFGTTILYTSYKWGHVDHFSVIVEDIAGVFKKEKHLRIHLVFPFSVLLFRKGL